MIKKYLPITLAIHDDYECDDVAYTIAKKHSHDNHIVTVVSSDTDFIQMLQEFDVRFFNPIKKIFISPPDYNYLSRKWFLA